MKKSKLITIIVVVVALIGLGSFAYYEFFDQGGNVSLKVMDAPMSGVSAVYLTFSQVAIHGTKTGWSNYTLASKTVNILDLTTSNASLLGSIKLTAQRYTQIRLYVQNVSVVMSGVSHSMKMMSNWADIIGTFNVSAHSTTTVIIAFNLNQELNMVSMTFTPVVGTTMTVG
ncbi:MAG: DUF4382 domain-containing protein [Thermoplasmataceae archaeon]